MILGKDEALAVLQVRINRAGSQDAAAKELGVSGAYLCDVLKHRREMGPKLLRALGMKRVLMYERF